MSRSPAHPFDVSGRTVFITGAARGIGAATAERLHAKGANVALVGLEPERLRGERRAPGRRARLLRGGRHRLRRAERAVDAHRRALRRDRRGDRQRRHRLLGALATAPVEQVERTLAVNLLGVWRTDRAVIEQITQRRGYLLNIASLSAVTHTASDGPLHDRQVRRRGAHRRAAHGDRSERRARRLRLLRLHRHRPRARGLRTAVGRTDEPPGARLPARSGAAVHRHRRDRAGHRTARRRACGRRAGSAPRSPCAAFCSR